MTRYLLFTIVIAWLPGCTHTSTFNADVPGVRTEVNERAKGRVVEVKLAGGEQLTARALHVAPDVATWMDPQTGEARSVSTDQIMRIQYSNRGRGVLEGLALGVVIGASAGALLGAISYDEPPLGEWCLVGCTRAEAAQLGAGAAGATGALVGGILGLGKGSRVIYTVSPVDTDP